MPGSTPPTARPSGKLAWPSYRRMLSLPCVTAQARPDLPQAAREESTGCERCKRGSLDHREGGPLESSYRPRSLLLDRLRLRLEDLSLSSRPLSRLLRYPGGHQHKRTHEPEPGEGYKQARTFFERRGGAAKKASPRGVLGRYEG